MHKYTTPSLQKRPQIAWDFTGETLTNYAGIVPIADIVWEQWGFAERVDAHLNLPVHYHVKFSTARILATILLGYTADLSRLCHMEAFSADPVVQTTLKLPGPIDENLLAYRVKNVTEAPRALWRLHHDRGEGENWIAAVKQQLHLAAAVQRTTGANGVLASCQEPGAILPGMFRLYFFSE